MARSALTARNSRSVLESQSHVMGSGSGLSMGSPRKQRTNVGANATWMQQRASAVAKTFSRGSAVDVRGQGARLCFQKQLGGPAWLPALTGLRPDFETAAVEDNSLANNWVRLPVGWKRSSSPPPPPPQLQLQQRARSFWIIGSAPHYSPTATRSQRKTCVILSLLHELG